MRPANRFVGIRIAAVERTQARCAFSDLSHKRGGYFARPRLNRDAHAESRVRHIGFVGNGCTRASGIRFATDGFQQNALGIHRNLQLMRMFEARRAVGWWLVGSARAMLTLARQHALDRVQFGRPIASFQLIQELIAKMLANVTACQSLMLRLEDLHQQGKLLDQHASLAKAFTTQRMRETVAWAREVHGANGIIVDNNIGRLFSDAEALYSYEGTFQMQNLIVGKAATGLSAFV